MSTTPSSIKLNLIVKKIPSNRLALTNRVYISPRTYDVLTTALSETASSEDKTNQWNSKKGNFRYPFVTIAKHHYEVEAHPDVQDDQVSLNRLQRRTIFVRRGNKVEVELFDNSKRMETGALLFDVSFVSPQSHTHVEIDTDNLAECFLQNHKGQFFKEGEIIMF